MLSCTEKEITLNGTTIHYYRTGGDKPGMVLLHGYTDDALCWQRVAADLSSNYDILIPDARGHGNSGGIKSGFSVPLMADDTAQLIRSETLEKPVIFGHSMGAAVTAQLAAAEPDLIRAIVLEDPPLMKTTPEMTQEEINHNQQVVKEHYEEFLAMQSDPYDEVVARVSKQYPDWNNDDVKWWIDAKLRYNFDDLLGGNALRSFYWREVFSKINCPTLLLYSDQERGGLVTQEKADEAKEICNLIEAVHIKKAGHCIHRDRYQETMQVIYGFLSNLKG